MSEMNDELHNIPLPPHSNTWGNGWENHSKAPDLVTGDLDDPNPCANVDTRRLEIRESLLGQPEFKWKAWNKNDKCNGTWC